MGTPIPRHFALLVPRDAFQLSIMVWHMQIYRKQGQRRVLVLKT